MSESLEELYQQAKSALRTKDYDRAGGLIKQILAVDETYKDASRLLAEIIKLKRRRWYNHPILWGTLGLTAAVMLGIFLVPSLAGFYADQNIPESVIPTITPNPTITTEATQTLAPTPTLISSQFTWKRISTGQEFPRDTIISALIDENDPDVMYIRTKNAGIYKSIDGGISWQPENDPELRQKLAVSVFTFPEYDRVSTAVILNLEDGEIYRYRINATAGGEILELSKDGKNWEWVKFGCTYLFKQTPDKAYVFCDEGLYTLPDSQQVGTNIPIEMTHPQTIVVAAQSQDVILIGGQEGLLATKNGGLSWEIQTNGLGNTIIELKISPEGVFFAQNSHTMTSVRGNSVTPCALYRSPDGGHTWKEILREEWNSCGLTFGADGETLYWNNERDGVLRSLDNGDSWQTWGGVKRDYEGQKFPFSVVIPHPVNSNIFYSVGDFKLLVTMDNQITWVNPLKQFTEYSVFLARLYFDSDKGSEVLLTYYDGGNTWGVYRSIDYGETWKKCGSPGTSIAPSDTQLVIDPSENKKIILALKEKIVTSKDGCTSWLPSEPGFKQQKINTIAIDLNHPDMLFAGTDGGAYISLDGGETWGEINDGLLGATVVYSIVVDKESNVYAATPYGIFVLEGNR